MCTNCPLVWFTDLPVYSMSYIGEIKSQNTIINANTVNSMIVSGFQRPNNTLGVNINHVESRETFLDVRNMKAETNYTITFHS